MKKPPLSTDGDKNACLHYLLQLHNLCTVYDSFACKFVDTIIKIIYDCGFIQKKVSEKVQIFFIFEYGNYGFANKESIYKLFSELR